jgi:hypothetical protein
MNFRSIKDTSENSFFCVNEPAEHFPHYTVRVNDSSEFSSKRYFRKLLNSLANKKFEMVVLYL